MKPAPLSLWRHDVWDTAGAVVRWTMARIATDVARRHGITVDQLRGVRRCQALSRARQEAMHLMMQMGTVSSTQVGRFLGGRDHTTILHGVKAHARRAAESAEQ